MNLLQIRILIFYSILITLLYLINDHSSDDQKCPQQNNSNEQNLLDQINNQKKELEIMESMFNKRKLEFEEEQKKVNLVLK